MNTDAHDNPVQGEDAGAHPAPPFILGIVGDSGSGKSTLCDGIRTLIGPGRVTELELDDYHRYTRAERAERGLTALNPQVHNVGLMQEHLSLLRQGRPIRNRSYSHADGTFGANRMIQPREVVLARGLLGFPNDQLKAAFDLAVFLCPDPDLLFRWKLRRDVQSRGYTEAEVLSHIARHLLDSKQFVLPQAERADLVVRYQIPDPEASDAQVATSLVLRRRAAEALREAIPSLDRFRDSVRVERNGEEVRVHLAPELPRVEVDRWALERFPDTYAPDQVGACLDEQGSTACRVHLAFVETLIVRLSQKLRRDGAGTSVDG